MKNNSVIILLMFFIHVGFAQTLITKPAEFVGGKKGLDTYLKENLIYPELAKRDSIEGYFKISIAIDDRGKPIFSDFLVKMSNCEECEKEALRLINRMPRWIPKTINEKATYSSAVVTIVFELEEGNVKVIEGPKTAKLDSKKTNE